MNNGRLELLKTWALGLMERQLSERLSYHCMAHTLDVAAAASRNAKAEGLTPEACDLAVAGALLHDIGYVECYQDNEIRSVELSRAVLPGLGYDPGEIEILHGMILATRLPQRPATVLEQIICDADLDYLGRSDYFALSDRLRAEMAAFGSPMDDREWLQAQLAFWSGHQYFLHSVRRLRDPGKAANLRALHKLYDQMLAGADESNGGGDRHGRAGTHN